MKTKVKKIYVYMFLMISIATISNIVNPKLLTLFNIPKVYYGYMYSFLALGGALSSRPFGKLWDKTNSKYIMLLCFSLCFSIACSLIIFSKGNPFIILLARFIMGVGFGGSVFAIGSSYITTESRPENRKRNQLYLVALFNFGVNFGYFTGGYVVRYLGVIGTLWFQATAAILLFFPGLYLIENGSRHKKHISFEEISTVKIDKAVIKASKNKTLKELNLYKFLAFTIWWSLSGFAAAKFFDFIYLSPGGPGINSLGSLRLGVSIVTIIFILKYAPIIGKKYDELDILKFAVPIYGLSWLVSYLSRSFVVISFALLITRIADVLIISQIASFITNRFATRSGQAYGTYKIFDNGAKVLGSTLLGYLAAKDLWLPFLILGLWIMIGTIVLWARKEYFKEKIGLATVPKS